MEAMAQFQSTVYALIHHYGYAGIFVVMALGNIGAPVGAEVVMPLTGGLVATGHLSSMWLAIAAAVLGELAGGTVGYAAGHFGGRALVTRYGKFLHLTQANLDRIHAFFVKYGTFAIFISRFIPVIRGIVSIPAGIADMELLPFYLWYGFGSLLFCGGLMLLGGAVGDHLGSVTAMLHKSGMVILAVVIVLIAAAAIIIARKNHHQRT